MYYVFQYCDTVKTTLKLEKLSGQQSDFHHEQYLLDLGKALYKLYFQLLLLVEAGNKIIGTLHGILNNANVSIKNSRNFLVNIIHFFS